MIGKIAYAHPSNYETGRTKPIQYIVIHYTANDGDTDENNGKYFQRPNIGASAHYFVDEDSYTISVLEKDTAWHCGAKTYVHGSCRNANSIGIEMCSEKDANKRYCINNETFNNTVNITKKLMKEYGIPLERVLRHYDVTGKNCPAPFVENPKEWERFLKALGEEENEIEQPRFKTYEDLPSWGKDAISKLIKKGCFADVKTLNLSEDMLRILVINERAGLYN